MRFLTFAKQSEKLYNDHKDEIKDDMDEAAVTALFKKIQPRNRPNIRLNPDPAGYPASISGSGSGFKNFAGFFAGYFIFKMYF